MQSLTLFYEKNKDLSAFCYTTNLKVATIQLIVIYWFVVDKQS
jgi:hypothetical protein